MFTALTIDNRKIDAPDAYPHIITFCQNCGHRLHPACVTPGNIYLKHPYFFHDVGVECDTWYEPVTDWHRDWQEIVSLDQREVSIEKGNVGHIADIYLPQPKIVIELQYSNFPIDIKLKRDAFYDRIFWLTHHSLQNMSCFKNSVKPVFIDLCDGNIQTPFGNNITKKEFIEQVLLNPNLEYENWIYGFDGEDIRISPTKKIKPINITGDGDHLVFITETNLVTQCLNKDCPYIGIDKKQNITQNDLVYINGKPIFICKHCNSQYRACLLKFNPRGVDKEREDRTAYFKARPYIAISQRERWEQIKQNKQKGAST